MKFTVDQHGQLWGPDRVISSKYLFETIQKSLNHSVEIQIGTVNDCKLQKTQEILPQDVSFSFEYVDPVFLAARGMIQFSDHSTKEIEPCNIDCKRTEMLLNGIQEVCACGGVTVSCPCEGIIRIRWNDIGYRAPFRFVSSSCFPSLAPRTICEGSGIDLTCLDEDDEVQRNILLAIDKTTSEINAEFIEDDIVDMLHFVGLSSATSSDLKIVNARKLHYLLSLPCRNHEEEFDFRHPVITSLTSSLSTSKGSIKVTSDVTPLGKKRQTISWVNGRPHSGFLTMANDITGPFQISVNPSIHELKCALGDGWNCCIDDGEIQYWHSEEETWQDFVIDDSCVHYPCSLTGRLSPLPEIACRKGAKIRGTITVRGECVWSDVFAVDA